MEKRSYVGVTKRKVKTRIKEHREDIKLNRSGTALSRKNREKEIKIDFINVKKLANYESKNIAYKREAVEILADSRSVNDMEHAVIEERWRSLLKRTTDGAGIEGGGAKTKGEDGRNDQDILNTEESRDNTAERSISSHHPN